MSGFNKAQSGGGAKSLIKFTTSVSGNAYKDKGGTVLFAGNANTGGLRPAVSYNLTLATDCFLVGRISGRVYLPVSPADSGNLGTIKLNTAAGTTFGRNNKGQYIGMVVMKSIAGVANTLLQSPAASYFRINGFTLTPYYKYELFSISGWDYVTGRAYFSGAQNNPVTLGQDKSVSLGNSLQGNVRFMYGAIVPSGGKYSQRNNW